MCKIFLYTFCTLYAAAIFLWLVGTRGWFGVEKDPLSGVFLIILGQPWARWIGSVLPEGLWPVAGAVAPAINVAIILLVCQLLARR